MLVIFLKALGLVLVLEGLLPFMAPSYWRDMMYKLSQTNDKSVRIGGLCCLVAGAMIVVLVHLYM